MLVVDLQGIGDPVPATLEAGNDVVVIPAAAVRREDVDDQVHGMAFLNQLAQCVDVPAASLDSVQGERPALLAVLLRLPGLRRPVQTSVRAQLPGREGQFDSPVLRVSHGSPVESSFSYSHPGRRSMGQLQACTGDGYLWPGP